MPDSNPTDGLPPKHDPFDAPDVGLGEDGDF
jgi:hypothetical protein